MTQPRARRPHMPGYGVLAPDQGAGLLPWSWAVERLAGGRHYWVCTVSPDGRPHATPVWAVWHADRLWFSCGGDSRKARNLAAEPRCAVTAGDPQEPVVVEGVAEPIRDSAAVEEMRVVMAAKYDFPLTLDFLLANAVFAVRPDKVIGFVEDDLGGTATRWTPPPPV